MVLVFVEWDKVCLEKKPTKQVSICLDLLHLIISYILYIYGVSMPMYACKITHTIHNIIGIFVQKVVPLHSNH